MINNLPSASGSIGKTLAGLQLSSQSSNWPGAEALPVQITPLIPGQIPGGNCLPNPSSITHGRSTNLPHAFHQQEWGIKRCSQHLMEFLFLIKFNTHYKKSQKRVLLAPNYILPNLTPGTPKQFRNWIPLLVG